MRVFIAVLYFFASILAPIGLMFLGVILAPPRLVLDQEILRSMEAGSLARLFPRAASKERFDYPGVVAGAMGRQEGGTIKVLLCEGENQARRVFQAYSNNAAQGAGMSQSSGPGYHAYKISEKGISGRVERTGRVILHAEAKDPDLVERLIQGSGIMRSNPEANWLTTLFKTEKYIPHIVIFLILYAAPQFRIWNRVTGWATRVPAKPGVEPVSEEELRRRLLAINDEDVPFRVVEGKGGKIEATWRLADAKWAGIMTLNKVKEVRTLQLRPSDKEKVCRALDIGRSVRSGVEGLELGFSMSGYFFRGVILAQWEYEAQYGFTFRDGRIRFEKVYEYKFDHQELKRPIVEVVTSSGWEYRPVLFISRILGG